MADSKDIALMAHLMRRAGFGASREELEMRVAKGYEATVEELLDPDGHGIPDLDDREICRHNPGYVFPSGNQPNAMAYWVYKMINSKRPLEEKIALFWHQVFATSFIKVGPPMMMDQIQMFRDYGFGSYRDLLMQVSMDPGMLKWLDNVDNHKDSGNENWGRELLELFSMGQGNYTEEDVKEVSRAFTGWTVGQGAVGAGGAGAFLKNIFQYIPEDHDDGEKVILGHRGRFNGEDVIDLIMKHPATTRFVSRHIYNFFVGDEVQVPSWQDVAPADPVALNIIGEAFQSSNYDIRQTLRVIFNSDFFKDEKNWCSKVKSPVELIIGTMKLVKHHQRPEPFLTDIAMETEYQGQTILGPPSVEGWHTGHEWIDSGQLVERINFVGDHVGNSRFAGIRSIIDRLATQEELSPEDLVDGCLDLVGPIKVADGTRLELIAHAEANGPAKRGTSEEEKAAFTDRVTEMLRLITAVREYQLG